MTEGDNRKTASGPGPWWWRFLLAPLVAGVLAFATYLVAAFLVALLFPILGWFMLAGYLWLPLPAAWLAYAIAVRFAPSRRPLALAWLWGTVLSVAAAVALLMVGGSSILAL